MKEIMKQTKKTEKMRQLTDAELRQVTGGGEDDEFEQQDCSAQRDKENCVQRRYCEWYGDKNGHYHCNWVSGS